MTQRFFAKQLFDGQQLLDNVAFEVTDGWISEIQPRATIDAAMTFVDGLVVPGFIDVQVNGGGGVMFNQTPTASAINRIGQAHAQFGTTGLLPTVITDDIEVMTQAADAVSQAIAEGQHNVLGIHFEGPHLSVARKGVHAEHHIRPLTEREFDQFIRQDLGKVVVTLAPENVSTEQIARLTQHGVLVCLGHSNASFKQVQAAIAAGARGFTHLFNAMSPLQSREPGMVGAALLDNHTWCGLIVDGHHVHPATLQLAIAAKAAGKMMLVTDAMPPVGDSKPSFSLYGQEIIRTEDRLNAKTGELAGSVLDMAAAVRNTVSQLGLPLVDALKMASRYPAEFALLADEVGSLGAGKRANFVVLDAALMVQQTWLAGECIYHRDSTAIG
ncbi:N-acetylglucosamine-6-phosphate deacetylase [Neiella sp. HB171785]|uniref:N-acetylgalactosamine-6-phosphate deacetylase n=1 Tax=Neiella litorisoli TaxID=2771431 RepID=A0A8J6UL24_9GAMM|nr:N-acetylglucosamine-6-phosphate deacetylase [Neiella litorisoli]MBD1388170.1 N-acetylglucosamine-6-phosphate deacetylase [Neiella litorisoli]